MKGILLIDRLAWLGVGGFFASFGQQMNRRRRIEKQGEVSIRKP
jgi:hypothetical protein